MPLDCLLIVTNEELGDVASRGYWGQTITRAWEGCIGGERIGDLSMDDLICVNGFVTGECPNSCACGMGWQCLALTPEWRAWRVKRISGAYCTQMGLFLSI